MVFTTHTQSLTGYFYVNVHNIHIKTGTHILIAKFHYMLTFIRSSQV